MSDGAQRVQGSRSRRGFTLVETLVVGFIIAVLAVIVGTEVPRTFKRQSLAAAANDVRQICARALVERQRLGVAVFVQVGPLTAADPKFLPFYLIADRNGNGAIDAFCKPWPSCGSADMLIDEYDLPVTDSAGRDVQQIALSTVDRTQVQSALWSSNALPRTTARSLMCDSLGRAINTTTGAQIAGVASLVVTHRNMVDGDGTLQPQTRFVIRVNPIFNVNTVKQVWDGTAWVQQS